MREMLYEMSPVKRFGITAQPQVPFHADTKPIGLFVPGNAQIAADQSMYAFIETLDSRIFLMRHNSNIGQVAEVTPQAPIALKLLQECKRVLLFLENQYCDGAADIHGTK